MPPPNRPQPRPGFGPTATSNRTHFDLSRSGVHAEAVNAAITAIEQVHGDGVCSPIPISAAPISDRAVYSPHATRTIAHGIRIRRDNPTAALDLVHEVFACAPAGSVCHQWMSRMFVHTGGSPRIAFWAAEFSSHIALVEHGAAVSLMPRLGRQLLPPGVAVLAVADPVPTRTVSIAWRRSMSSSPNIAYLRDLLVEIAPGLGLDPPA